MAEKKKQKPAAFAQEKKTFTGEIPKKANEGKGKKSAAYQPRDADTTSGHDVQRSKNTKKYQKIFSGESDSGESDLRQILEAPFLARRQYSGTMKEALGSLKYFGIEEEDLNIIATFDSAEMLRDCVEAGMGISILSYQMIRELHESGKILIYRLPEKEFCRELYLIYKNESFLPEIVKKFIHYTEKYFKKEF